MIDYIVTGGAGFIGRHLVRKLVDLGAKVCVVDDGSRGDLAALRDEFGSAIALLVGDLSAAVPILPSAPILFDLAARAPGVTGLYVNPQEIFRTNVRIALNVADAAVACGVHRLVYISSSFVYGAAPEGTLHSEEDQRRPTELYGWSKSIGEMSAEMFAQRTGKEFAIVRPFNVYGPGEATATEKHPHVIPDLILACNRVARKFNPPVPLELLGSGAQTRSFVHVRDFVEGLLKVSGFPESGHSWNLSEHGFIHIWDLATRIAMRCGISKIALMAIPAPPGDMQHKGCDARKAKEILGWEPKITLGDGLQELIGGSGI